MSEEEKGVPFVCQRCGRCCMMADRLLKGDASTRDVACWLQAGRYDILSWVGSMIVPDEDALFDVWVDPDTHDFADRCPWLRKERGSDLYVCAIYDVRPVGCRQWPADMAEGQKLGCPACQDIIPYKIGQGIEFPHKGPDESS